jgi:ABC-2 type transport system permease protein
MIYPLLIKQFLRSKVAIVGLSFLLLAGFVAIFIGKSFITKQQNKVAATSLYQKKHIAKTVQFENKEMGLTLYYLRFAYVNQLKPLTGISIGQRDVNLPIQQITIRNLEEKKYDSDLNNPTALQMGNLDFSFVLIYLFPLLIIAFCYNLLSEEKEDETWRLLCIQSSNPNKIIVQKLIVRYAFVLATLLVLLFAAAIILHLPFNAAFLATSVLAIFYFSFWFALCWWIISWKKDSTVNAVSLLSIWLLLTIAAPAAVNNYVLATYPVPEALHTAVANREGYHSKWDESKEATMQKFYNHYPQFRKYKLPKKEFSWLWYYAMQQMGDDDAAEHSLAMKQKLLQRDRVSTIAGYFLPTIHMQLQLNNLAQSGLQNQLQFLDSTTAFHEKKRLYFYSKIFEEAPVLKEDWGNHKVEFFEQEYKIEWLSMILPLVVAIVFFVGIGIKKFRKNLDNN